MTIIDITEENVGDYEGVISPEYLENIGRRYYRGIVGSDPETGGLRAALFWELKDAEDEEADTVSELQYFFAAGEDEGIELLEEYLKKSAENNVVVSDFEFQEMSIEEQTAMERSGFSLSTGESRDVFVTVEELAELKIAKKDPPDYIRSLNDLLPRQFKAGLMRSVFHKRYGLLDDLPFLPITWYMGSISSCVITDGKVNGLLLVHKVNSEVYRVELLFAENPDANINILNMMRLSIRSASEYLLPHDKVILRRHNQAVRDLVKKLFPDKTGDQVVMGIKEHIMN